MIGQVPRPLGPGQLDRRDCVEFGDSVRRIAVGLQDGHDGRGERSVIECQDTSLYNELCRAEIGSWRAADPGGAGYEYRGRNTPEKFDPIMPLQQNSQGTVILCSRRRR